MFLDIPNRVDAHAFVLHQDTAQTEEGCSYFAFFEISVNLQIRPNKLKPPPFPGQGLA